MLLTILGRPCAETHPRFHGIISARFEGRCNRPACSQKIQIGERIVCIGNSTWCHVACGVTMMLEQEQSIDLAFMRSQVAKYARDDLMAEHMLKRLDGACRPSVGGRERPRPPWRVLRGVPVSGRHRCLEAALLPAVTADGVSDQREAPLSAAQRSRHTAQCRSANGLR